MYPPTAAQIAAEIANQVTELNHATLPADECPGLSGVADVCEVLDSLHVAAERLRQSLVQSGAYVSRSGATNGRVGTGPAGAPVEDDALGGVLHACAHLQDAERLAGQLATSLDHASASLRC